MCRAACVVLLVLGACGEVVNQPFDVARCLDGLDNESAPDGLVDCAAPQCGEVTTCVPDSSTEDAGIVVGETEACPEGFEGGESLLHRGLQPGACEGCGCTPADTTCTAKLWTYASSNECFGDVGLSGGALIGIDITSTCSAEPIYYLDAGGVRTDIAAQPGCTASGTGTPSPSRWMETVKFCKATRSIGCGAGYTCVARAPTVAAQCALATGPSACDGYATTEADWYTGVDDQRTCGSCFCTAVGGDCNDVSVEIGSDYTCGDFGRYVADNSKLCFSQAPYSPPARVVGTPTPPVGCTSGASATGPIEGTGASTLCCAPQG